MNFGAEVAAMCRRGEYRRAVRMCRKIESWFTAPEQLAALSDDAWRTLQRLTRLNDEQLEAHLREKFS